MEIVSPFSLIWKVAFNGVLEKAASVMLRTATPSSWAPCDVRGLLHRHDFNDGRRNASVVLTFDDFAVLGCLATRSSRTALRSLVSDTA